MRGVKAKHLRRKDVDLVGRELRVNQNGGRCDGVAALVGANGA